MSKYLTNTEFDKVIKQLMPDYQIKAPVREVFGGRFAHTDNIVYGDITQTDDIVWQEKSHFSPNEVVTPVTETLFHFNGSELKQSTIDPRPTIVFARACDIHGLKRLDNMYLKNGGNEYFYYKRLRTKLKIVLLECKSSFDSCFCVSMGTNKTQDYAASVRFDDQGVSIEIKDQDLVSYFDEIGCDIEFAASFVQENKEVVCTPDSVCDSPKVIRKILTNHEMWDEFDKRCIACGRCTTSCTTCSCYSVFDVAYEENEKFGERRRQLSSCMVDGFSDMAGGHNFRNKHGERLRYRALHKVNDYKARQGENHMCVGCGRCDDRFPQYISFSNLINNMTDTVAAELAAEGEK
ncbi:anaerobic sulfite reductase subunit AsrA [Vibrio algicola]|uniref:Anaerobic sulfite reductase subunit AsrA n=1 Tax=Vibrio algicola TaxID=2662262 RepID=A0A5Q0TN72_9VIBR|nr:anaerobic sulfite reductase subunit AsrA [Vibrio algicola]